MRAQGHLPRVRFGAIAAAAIAIASIGHAAQSPTVDLDVTDRVVVASKIYSLVQQYFAHARVEEPSAGASLQRRLFRAALSPGRPILRIGV